MQVRGGKEVTLTPGQTFYEGPEDVHVVGRNASQTKPAKFVVFFVKDKGAPVLVLHQIETKTTTRKSNDGPVVILSAPDRTFPRCPGDRHTLDENASKTEPAKLLAVFVVDTDEKELLTPLKKNRLGGP